MVGEFTRRTPDNTPDYQRYSLAELRDALAHVDGRKYPQRKIQLDEEIARRDFECDVLEARWLFGRPGEYYELFENGAPIGGLEIPLGNPRHGTLEMGGKEYSLSRRGWLRGSLLLSDDNDVQLRATKPGAFSHRVVIEKHDLGVVPSGARVIVENNDGVFGFAGRAAANPLSVTVETLVPTSPLLRIFIAWIYMVIHRRRNIQSRYALP